MAEATPIDEIAALLRDEAAKRKNGLTEAAEIQLEKDSKLVIETVKSYIHRGLWGWGDGVCMVHWSCFGENYRVSREVRLANLRKKFPETSFLLTTIDDSYDLDTKNIVEAVRVAPR